MSIAEKLTAIAENEKRVYEAGKKSEYDAFWDIYQNNGNRADYTRAFAASPFVEEIFKPKYDLICKNAAAMFSYVGYINQTENTIKDLKSYLKKIGIKLDTSKCTNLTEMFYTNKAFTHIPIVSAESSTALTAVFYNATSLIEIEKLILKEDGTNTFAETQSWNYPFGICSSLRHIVIEGVIGNTVTFQWSPLTKESITSVINALSPTVTGKTLTLNKSAKEAAFTADEWSALIATKTNWTFSLV